MASPNSAFTDIVTTTLQGYSGEIADNVTKHNALLRQIDKKGNKYVATGRSIVQELEYANNSTVMWFSGAQTFDISASQTFSAPEFNYKQLIGTVVINGLEEAQNTGKQAVHNLIKARIRNLEKSLRNTVATALYGDGTGTGGLSLGGLGLLVADTPTNTVGGISGSSFAFWQNQKYSFSANAQTPSNTTIQHAMNTTWLKCIRGSDKPDIGVADSTYFIFYQESLQAQQRFTEDKEAGAGFTNLVYMAATPIIFDDQCTAAHMYFLNTDYLFLRPAENSEFKPLGDRASINQDAMVMPMKWYGNMTISNRFLQGVVIN